MNERERIEELEQQIEKKNDEIREIKKLNEEQIQTLKVISLYWAKKAKESVGERMVVEAMLMEMVEMKEDAEKALEGAMALEHRNQKIFNHALNLLRRSFKSHYEGIGDISLEDEILDFLEDQEVKIMNKMAMKEKKNGEKSQ